MDNNTNNVYIKVDSDDEQLTDEQIMLDKYHEDEYTNPYDEDFSDVMNVGGMVEGMGTIFDDR